MDSKIVKDLKLPIVEIPTNVVVVASGRKVLVRLNVRGLIGRLASINLCLILESWILGDLTLSWELIR